MSKIKHIHLFRNGTVLENRDKAVAKLNEFINGDKYDNLDGVAILALTGHLVQQYVALHI